MSVNVVFILFSFVIILILNHTTCNPLRDADILYSLIYYFLFVFHKYKYFNNSV